MGGYVFYLLGATINLAELLTDNFIITHLPSIPAVFAGMFIAQLSIVSHIFVVTQLFQYSNIITNTTK